MSIYKFNKQSRSIYKGSLNKTLFHLRKFQNPGTTQPLVSVLILKGSQTSCPSQKEPLSDNLHLFRSFAYFLNVYELHYKNSLFTIYIM